MLVAKKKSTSIEGETQVKGNIFMNLVCMCFNAKPGLHVVASARHLKV